MLNGLFVSVVLSSVLLAAGTDRMEALTAAILQSARDAVDLAIGLIGVMAFFLGLMRVAEDGGLLRRLARAISPVMRRLFPDVPPEHPAMSAMVLNIASNMLGLGNAATPFGIHAMEELDKLNGNRGTATNAMVLFLAINTAGLAILPSGVIGLRASLGSTDASGIFATTWFASGCATIVGVTAAMLLSRLPRYQRTQPARRVAEPDQAEPVEAAAPPPDGEDRPIGRRQWAVYLFWAGLLLLLGRYLVGADATLGALTRQILSNWILPALVAALILYGWARGVRVYDSLVEGAKQGFQVALRIIPYLVAILVAVGMLRASGGIDVIASVVAPVTELIRMPAEALPMAILRPLTGSGAFGVMAEIMNVHGPDSRIGYMVSTFQGSTETTFYTLAVYFGAVGIRNTRHTLPACLMADVAGILAAVFVVNLLVG